MSDRSRRFPPPWTIDDNGARFIVKDKNGQALTSAALLSLPLTHRKPAPAPIAAALFEIVVVGHQRDRDVIVGE